MNTQRSARLPGKRLAVLIIMVVALVAALAIGSMTTKSSKWAPELALDLQGGTQIILTPTTTDNSDITAEDLNQAIEIIRQRVDASGVAEAEISAQGGRNIIVGLPGHPSEETLNLVRTSAVMRMRPVIQYSGLSTGLTPAVVSRLESSATPSATPGEASGENTTAEAAGESTTTEAAGEQSAAPSEAASPTVDPSATYSEEELRAIATKYADANGDGTISDEPSATPSDASDMAWATERVIYESYLLDCTNPATALEVKDDPTKAMVACGEGGTKYILGPAEIEGTQLAKASSGWDSQRNQWAVLLDFDSKGAELFSQVTSRLAKQQSPRNQFAVVLDGRVISAASVSTTISGGSAQITGSGINQKTSATLANQLSFGSLPLEFKVQSEEQISATLGSESLRAGVYAGAIGVVLLVLYLLWAYHGLGVVAVASITLATGVSYLLVALLSWTIGYRLSMAGVVGFIVSIGITADSFIVFFERIRDEIREGRSLSSAVEHGWQRAKRTIYVADGVNLLCAAVLYFLAVGSVRGFAFTLGLTTILDLVVVIMFTYPVMVLLVRGRFFGHGHRWSGMSMESLGRVPAYRGRGEFRSRSERRTRDLSSSHEIDEEKISAEAHEEAQDKASISDESEEKITEALQADAEKEFNSSQLDEHSDESEAHLSLAQRKAAQRRRARNTDTKEGK